MEPVHQRNTRLIDEKFKQYLLPGIMMAMALQIGNIVDTILVGNFLGAEAIASIRLVLPVETIIQIAGYCLGIGASIAAGVLLGKRDKQGASEIFSAIFWFTVVWGLLFAVIAPFTAEPITKLLAAGGGEKLIKMSSDYLLIFMIGSPLLGIGLFMGSFLGVENHPELASAYMIVSNIFNLLLDYTFLKYTSMGTMGASLSTVLGYTIGMIVFIWYIKSPKRMVTFVKIKSFKPFKETFVTSIPMLVFMIMSFIKELGLNTIIIRYTGDSGLSVHTVCENVLFIIEMVTDGIIGVIPNIAGILYGERDYFGIRALCNKTLKYAFVATTVVFIASLIFTKQISVMFGITQDPLQQILITTLQLFVICLPFHVWNKFLTSYYETIEQTTQASLITFMQNGFLVIPLAWLGIYIDMYHFKGNGLSGLAIGFVSAEALSSLIAYIYRKIKFKGSNFYMIPDENPGVNLDLSIKSDENETPMIPREIKEFCVQHGVSKEKANIAALAAEEMAVNCIKFGGKSSHWIDICLNIEEDKLMLRIRDNGVPFDPTTYQTEENDFDIHGIEVIKAIATKITYIRAIDLNNTVLEFAKQ